MNDLNDLMMRCSRLSLLLGMAVSVLMELSIEDGLPMDRKDPLEKVLSKIYKGVDELFYNTNP